jgi:hypothetical protein
MIDECPMFRWICADAVKWILGLALLSTVHMLAQVSTANVTGTVEDATSARISDASVKLINTLTGTENDSITNHYGMFLLPGVIPGEYILQIDRSGFAAVQVAGLTLNVGDTKNFLIRMHVGSVTQIVHIDERGAVLNSADASVSTVVDRNFVANIPLNGRSFQDLISMTPGVVTQSPQTTGEFFGARGEFSVNGQQADANSFTVDGVSADIGPSLLTGHQKIATPGDVAGITALGTTQSLVSVDALQEFRVLGSTYSTEYGRTPGAQFTLLTRSGTNNVHGSLFDYLRNNAADAADWYTRFYDAQSRTTYHQNDFGGTLGAPVIIPGHYNGVNRMFFFFSYEGLDVQQPSAPLVQFVPSSDVREAAPAALQPVLQSFPMPVGGIYGYPSANSTGLSPFIASATSYPGTVNATSIRLDHTLSPRFSGFFRYGETPSDSQAGILSSLTRVHVDTRTLTLGATAQLSSSIGDDVRVGYAASRSTLVTTLDNYFSFLKIFLGTSLNGYLGIPSSSSSASADAFIQIPGAGASEIKTDDAASSLYQWDLRDTFTAEAGHHLLRFGIDQRHIRSEITPPALTVEADFFDRNSMLQNLASDIAITRSDPAAPVFNEFASFVQDEWRLSRSVTLSPGLRWEVDPPPHSGSGEDAYTLLGDIAFPATMSLAPRGTPLWHAGWSNLAPRIGAAWSADSNPGRELLIRGGAGMFFDTADRAAAESFSALGFSATVHPESVPVPVTATQLDFSTAVSAPYTDTTVFAFPQHLQLPYAIQWNVAAEKALDKSQTLTVSWVGANGRRLLHERRTNIGSENPDFGEVYFFPGRLTSSYESLQVKFQRSISHGLQALASYGWSHTLDYGSTDPAYPLTRANSDLDVRQNLQAALSWTERKRSGSWATRNLLGGWGVDGRVNARSAFPVTPLGNLFSDPATGNRYYSGVDTIAGRPVYLYGSTYPGGRMFNGGPDADNPAFVLPVGAVEGNALRNMLRGFGAEQINVALRREFPLHRDMMLQLRIDTFNLFNHPDLGYIDPIVTDALFGQSTLMLNQSFGSTGSLYEPGGPRSIQLSFRLHF